MPTVKESCRQIYNATYNAEKERLYPLLSDKKTLD